MLSYIMKSPEIIPTVGLPEPVFLYVKSVNVGLDVN